MYDVVKYVNFFFIHFLTLPAVSMQGFICFFDGYCPRGQAVSSRKKPPEASPRTTMDVSGITPRSSKDKSGRHKGKPKLAALPQTAVYPDAPALGLDKFF